MGVESHRGAKKLHSIAVSIGEPAGIGPDIIIGAWTRRECEQLPHFTVIGDVSVLEARARQLKQTVSFTRIENFKAAINCKDSIPVLQTVSTMNCETGISDTTNSNGVIEAIRLGTELVLTGEFSALTTCPINKKTLYDGGFDFPGHTEFLANLAEKLTGTKCVPVMMLAGPKLRSVPVTIHMALREVKRALTLELILETGRICAAELRDKFAISNPVLAIAGVNPHAGEEGTMGREEIEIITPAIDIMRAEGIEVLGPLPADTMFHERARATYDVAICMYHDQALIPAKTLGFDDSVNVTLGLPFIRTSPDHGTAFDIAGSGKARPDSFIAALKMAAGMVERERDSV